MNNHIFFWKPNCTSDYLSRLSSSPFVETVGDSKINYDNLEQYISHKKALLFGDTTSANQIIASSDPYAATQYGKFIVGFNQSVWNANKEQIVYDGAMLKYSQNSSLLTKLLATGSKTLVEANPFEHDLGAGSTVINILKLNKYPGQNLLGVALMAVRTALT